MFGYPAESMESDLRRSGYLDQYSEVCTASPSHAVQNRPDALLRSLLNDPNTSSPANVEASNLYKDNRREYTKRVRQTVEKSWED